MNYRQEGFQETEFPKEKGIVYIIVINYRGKVIPLYIGQTGRSVGRVGDYIAGKYSASTDFKVSKAVEYLREKNYEVKIQSKRSSEDPKERRAEEKRLINYFRTKKYVLLNDLKGYNYKNKETNEKKERQKVCNFIDDKFLKSIK